MCFVRGVEELRRVCFMEVLRRVLDVKCEFLYSTHNDTVVIAFSVLMCVVTFVQILVKEIEQRASKSPE